MTPTLPPPVYLPQLSASGKNIVDPDGNIVILHGVNLCSKTAQSPEELGFDIRNAELLKKSGFSVVRLGVPWANTQPYLLYGTDGKLEYNLPFLDSIKRTIQMLAQYGIYTLVDFHQDAYSVPWGFGAPSWAMVMVAGQSNWPQLAWPMNTFGGSKYVMGDPLQPTNIETDLNSAFDSFWQNSAVQSVTTNPDGSPILLLDAYAAMLQFVSGYLSDQQGNILGYDPINEPEPGSAWVKAYSAPTTGDTNPFNFKYGCQDFDENYLAAFYINYAIPALRNGHREAMVWFEPNIYFDYNAPTFLGDLGAANVGFNFHNYDSFNKKEPFSDPVENALQYRRTYDLPLLCSEFGGTAEIPPIKTVADINDGLMLSWIFWAWFNNAQFNFYAPPGAPANDPRLMGVVHDMWQSLDGSNVNQPMLDALTRVYPRITAGTPLEVEVSENQGKKTYSFKYSTLLPNNQPAKGTTVIVVPAGLYPNDYDVSVPDGANATKGDGVLEVVWNAAPTTVMITITPIVGP